jgi:snRNA-activating protein complex (SNAPc), subunit 3
MLYIEGTFYNDMRNASAVDYSYPIRAFCHSHGLAPPPRPADAAEPPDSRTNGSVAASREAGAQPGASDARGYECADMAHTTFQQLWLRLGPGAGYVYCHQVLPTSDRLWYLVPAERWVQSAATFSD